MPLYEYYCGRCGKNFEIQHKMADPAPNLGPDCDERGCQMERQISRVSATVRSPNPMAQGFRALQNSELGQKMTPADSDARTKSEPKSHQCGSGCALHN
jgi:putative FmdB family regulatory protein